MMNLIDNHQRAITLLEKLPDDRLPQALALLEALSQHQQPIQPLNSQVRSDELLETSLLEIIHRRLPGDDQARLQELRQRHEAGTITEAEHQDYLALIDRIEAQDVERAAALLRLAQLRNADLNAVLAEFLSFQPSA